MHRLIIAILIFTFLASCGSSRNTADDKSKETPQWTVSKPADPLYYRGIGVALIRPDGSHLQAAKNQALADLASEISVEISTSTMLRQLELNKQYNEEFRALTEVHSIESIEDFELVGTYQAEDHFWVHYRLGKQQYAHHRAARKQLAIDHSYASYKRAVESMEQYAYPDALKHAMQAMEAVKSYLTESMQADSIEGDYGLALFSLINTIVSDIHLRAPTDRILRLRFADPEPLQNLFSVESADGTPLKDIPVYLYFTGGFLRENQLRSNEAGLIPVTLPVLVNTNQHERLEADVNLVALAEQSTRDPLLRSIIARQSGSRAEVGIDVRPPLVFVQSEEQNLGEDLKSTPIAAALSEFLLSNGFALTEYREQADIKININARTEYQGEENGFYTTLMKGEMEVRNRDSQLIGSYPLNHFRGVQLNRNSSGRDAFNRAIREMEDHGFRKLLFP